MKRFSEGYADTILVHFFSFFCMSYKMYILFLNVTCDEIFILSLVEVDLNTHILPTFIVFILNELNKKTLPCSGTCFQSHVLFFQFFFVCSVSIKTEVKMASYCSCNRILLGNILVWKSPF